MGLCIAPEPCDPTNPWVFLRRAAAVSAAFVFAPLCACLRPNPAYLGLTGSGAGSGSVGGSTDTSETTDPSPDTTTTGVGGSGGINPTDATASMTGCADTGTATWWDGSSTHRVRLTILPTTGTDNLLLVPVYVRLEANNPQWGEAQPSRKNIRFFTDDGTQLPHETEQWETRFASRNCRWRDWRAFCR